MTASTTRHRQILVVDDEASIRELLSDFLRHCGYQVQTVPSADDALRHVQNQAPDLVICDIQMDDRDGLVLVDQLRELLPSLPVMILTGVVFDAEVIRENILKRASSCLCKTASLQDILKEVKRLTSAP